jgi:hypothetical protein
VIARVKVCQIFRSAAKSKFTKTNPTATASSLLILINNHGSNCCSSHQERAPQHPNRHSNTVSRTVSHCSRDRQPANLRQSTCMEPIDRLGAGELELPSTVSTASILGFEVAGCKWFPCPHLQTTNHAQRRRQSLPRKPFLLPFFPLNSCDHRHVPRRASSFVARWRQLPRPSPRSPQPQPACAPLRQRRRLPSVEEGYYSPRDGPARWRPLSVFGCRSSWKWLTWVVSPRKRFPRPSKRLKLRRRGR